MWKTQVQTLDKYETVLSKSDILNWNCFCLSSRALLFLKTFLKSWYLLTTRCCLVLISELWGARTENSLGKPCPRSFCVSSGKQLESLGYRIASRLQGRQVAACCWLYGGIRIPKQVEAKAAWRKYLGRQFAAVAWSAVAFRHTLGIWTLVVKTCRSPPVHLLFSFGPLTNTTFSEQQGLII